MNNINEDFAEYLYNRLPRIYRNSDKDEVLKRFIESFVEGGYQPLLQDTINIMDLLDVDKCPSKFLPKLCEMYGYEYTLEIPELFQRRLLKYIVELYKRKGTKSVVRFIARELTGFESEIIENKDFTEENIEVTGWDKSFKNYRNFILKLTAPYEDSNLFNKEDIVVKIVNDFLPTNSQVFVITAYWLKEEANIIKYMVDDLVSEKIQDYSIEAFTLGSKLDKYYDIIKIREKEYLLNLPHLSDENSVLNRSIGLVTNYLNSFDIIKEKDKPDRIILL